MLAVRYDHYNGSLGVKGLRGDNFISQLILSAREMAILYPYDGNGQR